jgi:tripartite-type tricarboxylate transporter receptor subunit TctC
MARTWIRTCVGALALLAAPFAHAQNKPEPFYKGKTINIVVGFGPGGGYDLYARLLARFLGNYIPGNPNVIVQNLTGAGGVRAANQIYTAAPKDGTYIAGVNQGTAMFQMLGGKGAQYDPAKFQWLGSMAHSNNTVYMWRASGVVSIDDARKREVSLAGSGVISDANIYPAVLNALLDTKFKIINGYTGTNDSNLALERGEVEGRGGGAYSSLVSTKPDWLRDNKLAIICQIGFEKEPDLPDVPLLLDLVKGEEAKQIATVVTLPTAIGYNHWVAPEVPADRVEILRKAYEQALKDPELIAEAAKQSLEIRPKTGEELAAMVKKASAIPQPILDKTAKILEW